MMKFTPSYRGNVMVISISVQKQYESSSKLGLRELITTKLLWEVIVHSMHTLIMLKYIDILKRESRRSVVLLTGVNC